MQRVLGLFLCVCLLALSSGCNFFPMRSVAKSILPSTGDRADGTESSDPWIGKAAREGRQGFPTESAQDPWGVRQYTMSQKARDIEANFGIIE